MERKLSYEHFVWCFVAHTDAQHTGSAKCKDMYKEDDCDVQYSSCKLCHNLKFAVVTVYGTGE